MTFTLLPAVDVADAKAVRPAAPTRTDTPQGAREAALAWQAAGATWIHLVDLASGGISAIEDLVVLAEMASAGSNVEGSIVGGALYAGRFTLPEALEAIRQVDAQPARSTSTVRGGRP